MKIVVGRDNDWIRRWASARFAGERANRMGFDLEVSAQESHARFVQRVVELGEVWGLHHGDGWCASASDRDSTRGVFVRPFWSDRAYAARAARGEWARFEPTSIPLFKFVIAWLTGMADEGVLVGTNWSRDLVGAEVDPAALQRQLIDAMSSERRAELDAELEWVRRHFDSPSYRVLPCERDQGGA